MDAKRRKNSQNKSIVVIDEPPSPNDTSPETESIGKTDLISNSNKQSQYSCRIFPLNSQNTSNSSQTCSSNQLLMIMPNNQNILLKRNDNFSKTLVDQKRRLMHKEIERRRRDKINDWIGFLSKQVPDCASDRTKQGQSKGGILAKTAKYIQELRTENERLNNLLKEKSELSVEIERLRQHLIETEAENKTLKSLIKPDQME